MIANTILIVDDHTAFAEALKKAISAEKDMKVVEIAHDGEEAVKLATQLHPDVVIMDIALPKLSGIEATKEIKKSLPSTAVLMLSAYGYKPYVFHALEAGAAGYLLKNVRFGVLINAVKALKMGETIFDHDTAKNILTSLANIWHKPHGDSTRITDREMEILKLGAKGLSNKEIAKIMKTSQRSLQYHYNKIFKKLNVASKMEAILHCLKEGWLILDEIAK